MDASQQAGGPRGLERNRSSAKPAPRPRQSTRGPLDAHEPSPLSAAPTAQPPVNPRLSTGSRPGGVANIDPRTPSHSPARPSPTTTPRGGGPGSRSARSSSAKPITARDFSYLLKPEIYHQLSPLTVPAPFRNSTATTSSSASASASASSTSASTIPNPHLPNPDTPIPQLLSQGHFRAAAIAAVQALTSSPVPATSAAAHPPITDPTDHAAIFSLLYVRLSCLCLIDAVALAAQESKALEDLSSAFYLSVQDDGTTTHLCPWELRVLAVRLQTLGFGDPRRAIMSYYDLARDARSQVARHRHRHRAVVAAAKAKAKQGNNDNEGQEEEAAAAAAKEEEEEEEEAVVRMWEGRVRELGVRVAGALVEMDDLAGAAEHLATLPVPEGGKEDPRLAMSKALLWLHLGDVGAARETVRTAAAAAVAGGSDDDGDRDGELEAAGKIIDALADMADGEYEVAAGKWRTLGDEMARNGGLQDEMVGVNLAVCLLYIGRMDEGRQILESQVDAGRGSRTLLFNLTTMYELCSDRAKTLKFKLAERMADKEPTAHGWEKTNADFKL